MIKLIFDTLKEDREIDRKRLVVIFNRVIKKQFASSSDLSDTFECIFIECVHKSNMIELLGFNTEPIQIFTKKSNKEFLGSNSMKMVDYVAMLIKLEKLGLDFGELLHSLVFNVRHFLLKHMKCITHNETSILWYDEEANSMKNKLSITHISDNLACDDIVMTRKGYFVKMVNETESCTLTVFSPKMVNKI